MANSRERRAASRPCSVLMHHKEVVGQRAGDDGLPGLVAEGLRERLRLPEMDEHARPVAEDHQRESDVEPEVDGLGLSVRRLRQPCQRGQRMQEATASGCAWRAAAFWPTSFR